MEFKTFEEMKSLNESEVIKYSSALMDRKLELANSALNGSNNSESKLYEANEIIKQLELLAKARETSIISNQ